MVIKQIFNNNVVLVRDDIEGKEFILTGSGIGFQKKKGMQVDIEKIEKKFISSDDSIMNRIVSLASEIDPEIFEMTNSIVNRIEDFLGENLYEYIYPALADHIAFALKRNKEGIVVRNTILYQIKRVYSKEFEAGMIAVNYIKDRLGIDLGQDEAAFIAVHIVNSYYQGKSEKYQQDIKVLKILKDVLNIIRYYYKIDYRESDLDYERLVTHVRFFAKRLLAGDHREDNSRELFEVVKIKYDKAYGCVEKIEEYVSKNYGHYLSDDEKLYLTMHIERVSNKFKIHDSGVVTQEGKT